MGRSSTNITTHPRMPMKFMSQSLKTSCIITLVRNYKYINLTILPEELSAEIMEAIRDPKYGEQKVTVCYFDDIFTHHTDIVDYLYHHDPQNQILRHYGRETEWYNYFRDRSRTWQGVIYDESRDTFVIADYTHEVYKTHFCYLVENLPPTLLKQLETKYKIEVVNAPLSAITLSPMQLAYLEMKD